MFFFKIPFPEKLSTDEWVLKFAQLKWLSEKGILGSEFKKMDF